jgi:hypothetical protein
VFWVGLGNEVAMNERKKILYIAGWGRSGSTLVDNILGQVDGFFSVGELSEIWERGSKGLCSCGVAIAACEVWVRIFTDAFGLDPSKVDFARLLQLTKRTDRLRHLWWLLIPAARNLLGSQRGLREYMDATQAMYQSVFNVTGASTLVDSSKHPSHGYLLGLLNLGDVYVLHLVRDSRATAYSFQQRRVDPGLPTGYARQFSVARACSKWSANNFTSEWLWKASDKRYLRLRYEEFAARPKQTIETVLRFVNEERAQVPFLSDHAVELRPLHGVAGNPIRYKSGTTDIRPDNRWESKMNTPHRLLVTALTSPGLLHYGYRLKALSKQLDGQIRV